MIVLMMVCLAGPFLPVPGSERNAATRSDAPSPKQRYGLTARCTIGEMQNRRVLVLCQMSWTLRMLDVDVDGGNIAVTGFTTAG